MPEIKPRIESGVPWCDVGCPQGTNEPRGVTFCFIDGRARYVMDAGRMSATNCPHAVKRMAVALKEISKGEGSYSRDPLTHADNCIEEMKGLAMNALMVEREE